MATFRLVGFRATLDRCHVAHPTWLCLWCVLIARGLATAVPDRRRQSGTGVVDVHCSRTRSATG